jgi:methyl-accepting chemotaxis protein
VVRHPDVPARVFEDLWETLQRGQPWSQIVKNRCKDGNHYWVEADVTPVFQGNRISGYISVRQAAPRDLIPPTEEAYQKIEQGEWSISKGRVFTSGWEQKKSKLNLFSRLKISSKLMLTALLAFGTIVGLLGFIYFDQSEQIAQRDKERLGVQAIQSLRTLAQHLPQHRGMGNAFLNGDRSFQDRLKQVEQKIEEDLIGLQQTNAELGAELHLERPVTAIGKSWRELSKDWEQMGAAESFAAHSKLIQQVLELVVEIGERSNLMLDPDLDTFLLIDAVVNGSLQLVDVTGQLRGFGAGVVAKGAASKIGEKRITVLSVRGELLVKNLRNSLSRAAGANENTRKVIAKVLSDLESATYSWEQQVKLVSSGQLDATNAGTFFASGSTMIGATLAIFDHSTAQLMKLLDSRIDAKQNTLFWSTLATLFALTLMSWITWLLVRSITLPITHAGRVMKQIASGNYNNQIRYAGEDEVALMLMGLKSMQIKSGADLNEMTELARETSRIKIALDGASTNVMIADQSRTIVYMNPAIREMLLRNERAIQQELPSFSVAHLMGHSIDQFHQNPQHQAQLLGAINNTHQAQIRIGGRVFDLAANPVISATGERLGVSVEWADVTEQVLAEEVLESLVQGAVEGDLSNRIDNRSFDGFMKRMADSINNLMDTFDGVLVQTRQVIGQINESVVQVRNSSQDLASSTEQQSSAIEQVSTSLEETDSQTSSNATNASVANQLAQEASSVADEGQQQMKEMVLSMDGISSSSQDIAKIIKVIDEIAFQTNLLALNAAVEAARAGKYGKGFAVVAQEVRDLAGRSAEAAKETAELIDQSTQQVADGVKVADATAGALEGIVENVVKVRDLVAEISTASEEQAKGIVQINDAVSQISDGAQSGSDQSLEMASAADQLASVTDQLSADLARFQLHGQPQIKRQAAVKNEPVEISDQQPIERTKAATVEPKALLPLDQDERDFGDF